VDAHAVRNRELWDRTAVVAGRLNRAQAELVDIAVELIEDDHWGAGGFTSPQHYLVVRAGLSPAHAADVVRIARRRTDLPDAAAALTAGELSLDQTAVLARRVPTQYQASMTALAREATVPQLSRIVSRHAFPAAATEHAGSAGDGEPDPVLKLVPQPTEPELAEKRACARPQLSMRYDTDGRFQLRYSAPATIGALVEQAIREAKDALFLRRTSRDDTTGSTDHGRPGTPSDPVDTAAFLDDGGSGLPTYADAIEELAARSLSTIESASRRAHYRVYLHLDTSGAWINGRHAIPQRLLDRFLTDGVLQPIRETSGTPVSVGRAMRILPERSRRLIEDRDGGCRFPGCTATRYLEIHHLKPWADNGPTDLDNQISLCPVHHDAIDRSDYTITGDPTRPAGLTVINRYGLPIRPPRPPELAPPPAGDPPVPDHAYHPPTGGPLRWTDIEVPPDEDLP
jgi:hypothetical protein